MKQLFEEVNLNHITFRNRILRSATWEGIATPDGGITEVGYKIYEELAKGQLGGIITGFTSVADNDFYMDGMMRLSRDELIDQHAKLVKLLHKENTPVITQLALGGYYRQKVNGSFKEVTVNDLTENEIEEIIQKFIHAAIRAEKAGYDGVQIHIAHFFFLSRFVSPAVNQRTDMYGGNNENRFRIVKAIVEGIKAQTKKLHVTAKINASDFIPGGLEIEDSIELSKTLVASGIDSIEVSGNGTSVSHIRTGRNEGYFVPYAQQIANAVPVPIIVVGGFRSKDMMESVIQTTNIDFVSISRPLLREPDWVKQLAEGVSTISKCISCNACYNSPSHRCVFRK
ncbi:NADH:flavin oxidoreductase [Veillonella sp. R32]|uniref:NADH:flavin oxidoreductase n=1 Tax=Veillonella sp. R32 TaxID=2021312 RepID=UPI0013897AF0|nr:NADH:flavin oxidoreductase [Veillonella sp. R32]KAF1683491.1 NADH-dependent flavin oxidoreductase [Veillonella sp. R32]